MKMNFGKYAGQPVANMRTTYLFWLISNDNIRYKQWPTVEAALRVLRERFGNLDAIVAELQTKEPPPQYWKAKKQIAERKAEKLRKLEVERSEKAMMQAIESARRRSEWARAVAAEEQARQQQHRQRVEAIRAEIAQRYDVSDLL